MKINMCKRKIKNNKNAVQSSRLKHNQSPFYILMRAKISKPKKDEIPTTPTTTKSPSKTKEKSASRTDISNHFHSIPPIRLCPLQTRTMQNPNKGSK